MAKYFLGALAACFLCYSNASAQCTVSASANGYDDIVCGDCTELNASGRGQGMIVFNENFNTGVPVGWDTTQQATFTNPCSPNGVDGTTHIWFGNISGVPRLLRTVSYDFSSATAGVTICFDLLFAAQTGNAGTSCEGPDEADEGVHLQYTTDGGATWKELHYFDPNGGNDPSLINWNNWCFQLPQDAITTNTQIRWFQDNDSGKDYDHWGLDNVVIYFNDPTYEITWLNDNFSFGQGSSGGQHAVCPRSTTDYIVRMSNGSKECFDTVRITVNLPDILVDAGADKTICTGGCTTIGEEAKVIKRHARTIEFANIQPDTVDVVGIIISQKASVSISVRNLNMSTVQPGSIASVCLDQVSLLGFGNSSQLELSLVCPDGTRIRLMPTGQAVDSFIIGTLFTNTCFVPAGPPISSGTHPYSGNFGTNQPFDNLVGCTANGSQNGEWTLEVAPGSFFGFGTIIITGWSITFDDPEISYGADFIWEPTAGLSDPNLLQPSACPSQDTSYVLTATDSAGCVTVSDTIHITVDSTNLNVTAVLTNPACSDSNGIIALTVANGSGNYNYFWSDGSSNDSLINVPAGVYSVTVNDLAHCQKDTSFVLSSSTGPVLTSITTTGETCRGDNDGTATASASGGTGALTFVWSNNKTGTTITGLTPGSYTVTITDAAGCKTFGVVTVPGGQICCDIVVDLLSADTRCSNSCDGYAEALITNGFPPFTYQWSDAETNPLRNNFCAGNYILVATDRNNCSASDTVTIGNPAPVTVDLGEDFTICSGGSATLDAGDDYFSFLWSTGDTTQIITVSESGDYSVTVTSPSGCDGSDLIIVTIQNSIQVVAGNDTTIIKGNSVTLNATTIGTISGNYFWEPADFLDSPGSQTTNATPDSTITYSVTFLDEQECYGIDSVTITVIPEIMLPIVPEAFTPNGDSRNETIYVIIPNNSGTVKQFKVYNRWSELVHDSTTPWDGKYHGKEQPVGTFVYYSIVELADGTTHKLSGAFSLLR